MPELVENIIIQLPPLQTFEVQLLSKMWRDLINRKSKRMNIAKCIKPDKAQLSYYEQHRLDLADPHPYLHSVSCSNAPSHSADINFNFHKALEPVSETLLKCCDRAHRSATLLRCRATRMHGLGNELAISNQRLSQRLDEFATVPRSQAVGLRAVCRDMDSYAFEVVHCTVYVQDGVTLGDILRVQTAIFANMSGVDETIYASVDYWIKQQSETSGAVWDETTATQN